MKRMILTAATLGVMGLGAINSFGAEPATAVAPLPQAIASFGAATDGHWLYVLGGHTGVRHHHSAANLFAGFLQLNLLDRTSWEILPGGVPLQSVSLVAWQHRLYRVGGMRALNAAGEAENLQSVADVACFDPLRKEWSPLPPLPEPRSSHDAVAYRGQLYVAGGWTLDGSSAQARWLNTAWVFDLAAEQPEWKALPQQPFQRRAVALAAANGRLYIIGGMEPDGTISRRVDMLDLQRQQWSAGPDLPADGFGSAAIAVNERIYAEGMDGGVFRLREDGKAWERTAELSFPRYFSRLVTIGGDELLAVGGASRGGHLRQIESVSLAPPSAAPRVRTWVLPWPGAARNRQGMFSQRDQLYLFGGNNSLEQHDFAARNFVDQGFGVNLGALTIEARASFPARRQSMVTGIVGGSPPIGYALGGFGHDGQVARSFNTVYRYDFAQDRWTELGPKLPVPISQFGLVVHGSELWVFGGLDYDPRRDKNDRFRHSQQVFVWDTHDQQAGFKAIAQTLPRARRAFGCAVLGDHVYLVGGMQDNFKLVEPCDVFDVKARTWSAIPAPRRPRISPDLAVLNGRVYLAGGATPDDSGELTPNDSMECYDPLRGQWSIAVEHLPIPTQHARLFPMEHDLVLISTQDADGILRIAMIRP